MVKNAKNMDDLSRNAILIVGPPGAGKSTQWHTLPPKSAFVFGFDPNFEPSLRGADVDYEMVDADTLDIDVHPVRAELKKKFKSVKAVQKEPRAYLEFEKLYDQLWETHKLDKYKVIGFDSISTLLHMIMDRVQYVNGRLGQVPERQDYNMQMHAFHNLVRDVTYRKKIFVAIGHEKFYKGEGNNPSGWELYMTGDLRLKIPMLCANIWRMEADKGTYRIHTQSSSRHRYIRSSIRGLPLEVNTTFNEGWRHLQQYGLGRILIEAGYIPGPAFKSKLINPENVATSKKLKRR